MTRPTFRPAASYIEGDVSPDVSAGAITARHAKYKAPHYMTYMTYMTYYKQLAFAAISPLTFLCDSSRLVAAASYIEADVSASRQLSRSRRFGLAWHRKRWACQVRCAQLYDLYDLYPIPCICGQNGLFSKFFQIRLAIVRKEMYIRKSSVILELNASVDPAKLIRKL